MIIPTKYADLAVIKSAIQFLLRFHASDKLSVARVSGINYFYQQFIIALAQNARLPKSLIFAKRTLSVREVLGYSRAGQISPTTRHRCGVSS